MSYVGNLSTAHLYVFVCLKVIDKNMNVRDIFVGYAVMHAVCVQFLVDIHFITFFAGVKNQQKTQHIKLQL